MSTLKDALNRVNPNSLADALRLLGFGSMLRALTTYLFGKLPVVGGPYVGALNPALVFAPDAKALSVVTAYAKAGTGTLGPLAASATTPPAAGKYFLTPTGDLVFAIADAWTSVDVTYIPQKGDVVELYLPVVANAAAIPAQYAALTLIECDAIAGLVVTPKVIDAPGTAVAAGQAALDLGKHNVEFNAADAVVQCRVKFLAVPAIDVDALLESTDTAIL